MKRLCLLFCLAVISASLVASQARAQSCSIGGHNETSENFAPGSWVQIPGSPGAVAGAPSGTHLVISEVAPRGFGTGGGSDSSEYIEIYNPTTKPVNLDDKYLSDEISYYRIVNGPYPAANTSDWAARFPQGLNLNPGRTLIVCVTKAGFAASGAVPAAAAQYFLELRDSNVSAADDMTIITTGSAFPLIGGILTNPAATNGEWVVLCCWNGTSDNVCDIDYASWGATSATNPKMDKSLVSIDGPDADAVPTPFNADTGAGLQTNLGAGTALTKPNTYQRTGAEIGEATVGGNGCVGRVLPTVIDWVPVAGTGDIRFHIRWENQDDDNASNPINGNMASQEFGVFLPDYGSIGSFNVPPLNPSSFFDVFFEIPLTSLPPAPQKHLPGGGPAPLGRLAPRGTATNDCPPDTNWAGNVDIFWTGPGGQGGQVNKHYADLLSCIGGPPSYIHFRGSNCPNPMNWTVAGLCPGFSSTLVNEDFTPAPNPVPVGWTGWICVSTAPAVPTGTSCCFGITFTCNGATSVVDICSTACDWSQPNPPTLSTVDWTTIGTIVRFHQRWENQSTSSQSAAVSGSMTSQAFGVFQPTFGPIGPFNVPPMAPSSFFDVFFDIPLTSLPPPPQKILPGGGPAPGGELGPYGSSQTASDCPPDTNWAGNVDIQWGGPGGTGMVNRHYSDLLTCIGGPPSYIHFRPSNCPIPMPWAVVGLCPGFSSTMVNEDFTPAPNPLPVGWSGWICVSVAGAVPTGTNCCFGINFVCNGAMSTIDICSTACDWAQHPPTLSTVDWTTVGTNVHFQLHWTNPSPTSTSDPASGDMNSQMFGVFLPDFGPIGSFFVPPIPPSSFFDVFFDVPLSQLPPEPPQQLPGGGPPPGSPCDPPPAWHGNVDVTWGGPGGTGQVGRHFGEVPVCPGAGPSYVHLITGCGSALGLSWSISGLCAGFGATLVNEDHTPAPNPLPAGWTGWICTSTPAAIPVGVTCCYSVNFLCDGVPATIDVCAKTCNWSVVRPTLAVIDWVNVGTAVRFHLGWHNDNPTEPSVPASGNMMSQAFGVFQPNFGPIGQFNVPPMQPNSFFDVFIEIPLANLPPEPPKELPGGGPPPGSDCPPSMDWNGNVDVIWTDQGGSGMAQKHQGDLLVNLGSTPAYIHVGFTNCPNPAPWTITGLCPGFSSTLVNEDKSPAPNPIPPGWSGWICVSANSSVPSNTTCCIEVHFDCNGSEGVIDLCATSCQWTVSDVPVPDNMTFGIYLTSPNPSKHGLSVGYVVPENGPARLDVYNINGQLVRTVFDGTAVAGTNTVAWDGRAENGGELARGTYFLTLKANGRVDSKKIVLSR